MTIISQLSPQPTTVRAPITKTGWQWFEFEKISAVANLNPAGIQLILSRAGWWEFSVDAPQSASLRLGDEGVPVSPGQHIIRRQMEAGKALLQIQSTATSDMVGKYFWITARPL